MTNHACRGALKITDRELVEFMVARRPLSGAEAYLHIAAAFLTTAHRHKAKGMKLQEVRRLYKSLCEEKGLLDELRRRKLLLGPLRAP